MESVSVIKSKNRSCSWHSAIPTTGEHCRCAGNSVEISFQQRLHVRFGMNLSEGLAASLCVWSIQRPDCPDHMVKCRIQLEVLYKLVN